MVEIFEIFIPLFSIFTINLFLSLKGRCRFFTRFGIISLILLASLLSIVSLYASPLVSLANIQITSSDISGTQWFIDKKDVTISSKHIMSPPQNFASGIAGFTVITGRADMKREIQFADHFGYPEQMSLGAQDPMEDYYAVITAFDKIIYSTVWKQVGRFTDADFEALKLDQTVNKLYSNGEMEIYYIHSALPE